jgi:hypothetical protein
MTIRTKALEIMARRRKAENKRLLEIDSEITENMRLLTIYLDPYSNNILTTELEQLNHEREGILKRQGEKLASRAKTKWYNEGERSNKYFLNLLKRQSERSEMKSLMINGLEVKDPNDIRMSVTEFYRQLYNKDESTLATDDGFFDEMFKVDDVDNLGSIGL